MKNRIQQGFLFILCMSLFSCMGVYAKDTEVGGSGTYSVDETYTVIIPSTTIKLKTETYSDIKISVGKGTNIAGGHQLGVYVKETEKVGGSQFLLDRYDAKGTTLQTGDEADSVKVFLKKKDEVNHSYVDFYINEPVAVYSDIAKQDTEIGHLYLIPDSQFGNAKAGLYQGTLTFTIQIENAK